MDDAGHRPQVRAVTHTVTGGPEVLQLVDRDPTPPGPGEVQVRVRVSGVNPTDWKARAGSGPGSPVATGTQVPHQDGAGTVTAVGEGVDPSRVGERVWLWDAAYQRAEGTAQELTVVPDAQAVRLPDAASDDLGASLGIPALTAHRLLTVGEGGPSRLAPGALSGRTVLVTGGAGAVGHAAVELARWAGARVAATVSSPAKAALARAAGADLVVDYRSQDVAAAVRAWAPDGVDLVVEVALGANLDSDLAVLVPGGTIASYAAGPLSVEGRALMTANARLQFVLTYTVPTAAKQAAVEAVVEAVAAGALRVGEEAGLPLHRFPLERTAEAQQAVEGGVTGKVLVDLG